jgi:hypothetical protein
MTFNKPINIEASITQITLFTLLIPHETQVMHYNLQHGSQTQTVGRQKRYFESYGRPHDISRYKEVNYSV